MNGRAPDSELTLMEVKQESVQDNRNGAALQAETATVKPAVRRITGTVVGFLFLIQQTKLSETAADNHQL